MLVDTTELPTPLALVAQRINSSADKHSAEFFLNTTYLAEMALKSVVIAITNAIARRDSSLAYRLQYDLIRGDGLGTWEKVLSDSSGSASADYIEPYYNPLPVWYVKKRTKPEDDWYREARNHASSVFDALGISPIRIPKKPSMKDLTSLLVQIRNKTKAHGAVGADFFASANESYLCSVMAFLTNCPLFSWQWYHVRTVGDKQNVLRLDGTTPIPVFTDCNFDSKSLTPQIFVLPHEGADPLPMAPLLTSNRECASFFVPNGSYHSERADFIDYASGRTSRERVEAFGVPPAPLSKSETHGLEELDVQSNLFGNLPPLASHYVERTTLQDSLRKRLTDRNHPIITLHGRGGIGKTSLALRIVHEISEAEDPHFEQVIWFSARDIDLRPSGPKRVKQDVVSLQDIARKYGYLQSEDESIDYFSLALQNSRNKGTLFVFDNFETLSDAKGTHRFLDENTYLPNKVLITSRERSFVADYPILVTGMEESQAVELMNQTARSLHVEGILNQNTRKSLFDHTDGHPYRLPNRQRWLWGGARSTGLPPSQTTGTACHTCRRRAQ